MATDTAELLTAAQVAARLSVKPATISEWLRLGRIPGHRYSARMVRFRYDEVVAALEAGRRQEDDQDRKARRARARAHGERRVSPAGS